MLPAHGPLPGRGHDAGQGPHPLRPQDRHGLHDHAAHRHPRHVGAVETEVVEQAERNRRGSDMAYGARTCPPVNAWTSARPGDPALDPARPSGVPAVVADDVEALVRRASGRSRRPTRSSARRGPSPAGAARRGRRTSGSTAPPRRRPGRRAPPRRRRPGPPADCERDDMPGSQPHVRENTAKRAVLQVNPSSWPYGPSL